MPTANGQEASIDTSQKDDQITKETNRKAHLFLGKSIMADIPLHVY